MLRTESTSFLWRGVLAVALGIVAIAWPKITVSALIVLFAIYVFLDAVGQFQRAAAADRSGPVASHVAIALLDIAAGVVALVWPAITVFVLTVWVAAWAIVTGLVEIGAAFATQRRLGVRAGMVLLGIVSVLFGVVVMTHPHVGVVTVSLLFGLFLLVYGVDLLMTSARMRRGRAAGGEALGGWTDTAPYPESARRADRSGSRFR
jgi:uncharacterized membrane protein HdeD (DUF308 family)